MAHMSEAHLRHATYYQGVLHTINKLYEEGGDAFQRGLSLFHSEWDNIRVGQRWAETQAVTNDTAASLCSGYQRAGTYVLALFQHPREKIAWLTSALESARRLQDRVAEGAHLNDIGMAYDQLGQPQRAIASYRQRLIIVSENGDVSGEAKTWGNLGVAYKNLGDASQAIECFEKQLEITRTIGDRRGEANALGGLGIVRNRLGETQRAIECQRRSLDIYRAIGDRHGEGSASGNLAGAYYMAGDMERATDLYRQRLAIAREIGDRHGEGNALWGISLVTDKRDNRAQAIQYAGAALRIFEELESPSAIEVQELLTEWGV